MIVTKKDILKVCNNKISQHTIDIFYPLLEKYMDEYSINTKDREIFFIANILVESGRFFYTKELASGKAYEGRKDLGNTTPGDGVKYKGRGLIQITGKSNYIQLSKDFNIDLVNNPALLEQPDLATRSACWFWNSKKLNRITDAGNFTLVCKRINGGTNGLKDRQFYHDELEKLVA